MTTIGRFHSDLLGELLSTVANARPAHSRLVMRNAEAWVESALSAITSTLDIEAAARKAVKDSIIFALALAATEEQVVEQKLDIERLREGALAAIRSLQHEILDAAPRVIVMTQFIPRQLHG